MFITNILCNKFITQHGMYICISNTYTYPSNFCYIIQNQNTWNVGKTHISIQLFLSSKNDQTIEFCKTLISKV